MTTFKDLAIDPDILKALDEMGIVEPTEIQKKAIPLLLSTAKIDFHGQAQTGTGKTFAFGIPLFHTIDGALKAPQALIVAPTRELALQIGESLKLISKFKQTSVCVIYGGASMEDQIRMLKRGCQIVIGTPGRLNDHLNRKTLDLKNVKTLVLDEADIMLDMGFRDEIEEILKYVPKNRQIWLFSATVKPGISDLMKHYMQEPVSVRVSKQQIGSQNTKQYFCIVPFRARLQAMCRFIESTPDFYGFIFCQTKILTSEIAEQLIKRGYNVGALHGDMSQAQRNATIKKFKQQEITILVATDVAARGIDVANLSHVINYSIPEDPENYVHRIGRTGRAGKEGTAITFVTKSELRTVQHIERKFHVTIEPIDVPTQEQIIQGRLILAQAYIDSLDQKKELLAPDAVKNLLTQLSAEKIKELAIHLLHDKFLSTMDLVDIPYTHVDKSEAEQLQEIYISMGTEDGVTRDDIHKFMMDTGAISEAEIRTIRVIKHRSFVKLAGDCSPELLQALRGKTLLGRKVRVDVTCLINEGWFERPQKGRGDRSGGGYSRSGGGRKDRYHRGGGRSR